MRDPASRDERSELTEPARLAARKAAGGVDPTAFDQHRQRTLMLLAEVRKSLEYSSGPVRWRSTSCLASGPRRESSESDSRDFVFADIRRIGQLDRFFRARHADRARIDLELSAGGLRVGQAAGTAAALEAEDRLPNLSARLDSFAVGTSVSQVSLSDARAAITALLGRVETDPAANTARKSRCTMCHDLTAAGDQLAPIRAAGGRSCRAPDSLTTSCHRRATQLRDVPREHPNVGESQRCEPPEHRVVPHMSRA